MTKEVTNATHTPQELLEAYDTGKSVWLILQDTYSREIKKPPCQRQDKYITQIKEFIKHPEEFTLTDPNQKRPKVGQQLTLENLRDKEFMQEVKQLEIESMHTRKPDILRKFDAWENGAVQFLEWCIKTDLTVTITEVVEGE